MANKGMKGVVEIYLGGSKKMVKFDFNAICDLEEYFDRPAMKIFDLKKGVAFREIRGTLWVGLKRHHEDVDIEDVGDWIQDAAQEGRLEQVSEQLGEALSIGLAGLAGPVKNPKPPKAGAKKSSASTSRPSSSKQEGSD